MISSWQKELFWRMLNAGLGQKSVSVKRRFRRGRINLSSLALFSSLLHHLRIAFTSVAAYFVFVYFTEGDCWMF